MTDVKSRERQKNWTTQETLQLIQVKFQQIQEIDGASERQKMVSSTQLWKKLTEKLVARGMQGRDWGHIKTKWENLCGTYKKIKDYDKSTGCAEFFSMTAKERIAAKLLPMDREIFEEMDAVMSFRPNIAPPVILDTSAPPPSSQSTGNAAAVVGNDLAEESESQQAEKAERTPGSTGKLKRKARRGSEVVDVMKLMVDMQAGAEEKRAKRQEDAINLEKEFMVIERERLAAEKEMAASMTAMFAALAQAFNSGQGSGQGSG